MSYSAIVPVVRGHKRLMTFTMCGQFHSLHCEYRDVQQVQD